MRVILDVLEGPLKGARLSSSATIRLSWVVLDSFTVPCPRTWLYHAITS